MYCGAAGKCKKCGVDGCFCACLPVLLHGLPAVQLKPTLATTQLALSLALVPHPCCKLAQPAEELSVQQALVQQAAVRPGVQRHA